MTDERIAEFARRYRNYESAEQLAPDALDLLGDLGDEVDRLRAQVTQLEAARNEALDEVTTSESNYWKNLHEMETTVARAETLRDRYKKLAPDTPIDVIQVVGYLDWVLMDRSVPVSPQETPEPIVRVLRAGDCWYWVCSACDDVFSPLMQESAVREAAAEHESRFHPAPVVSEQQEG